MTDLTSRIAQLSPAKRALLEARLLAADRAPDSTAGIPRRSNPGAGPLSSAQKRFWFLEQISPGDSAYIVPLVTRLHGAIDLEPLENAIRSVVQRHEILRTTYILQNGNPVQVISDATCPFDVIDLTDRLEEAREFELQQLIDSERRAAFDLTRQPIFRAKLIRLSPVHHVLLLVTHHIAFDGWSVTPLYRDLSRCYRALIQGDECSLPALPIQYADFAAWEQSKYRERTRPSQSEGGAATASGDREDRNGLEAHSCSILSRSFARRSARIGLEQFTRLSALSASENITLFTALLAIFTISLAADRAEDAREICVPHANRSRPELEEMVGCFIETLVLRIDLNGAPTVRELLRRVHQTVGAAFEALNNPLETPFGRLGRPQESGRSLSPDVMFRYSGPAAALSLPGIEAEQIPTDQVTANFGLNLTVNADADGAALTIDYDTTCHSSSEIDQLLRRYQSALEFTGQALDSPVTGFRGASYAVVDASRTVSRSVSDTNSRSSVETVAPAPRVSAEPSPAQPTDTMEAQLLSLFRVALNRTDIGIDDNFFAAGGRSLAAMALHARLEALLGREIPLTRLFQSPTVRLLAASLKESRSSPRWLSLLPLRTEGSRPPLFFVQHHANTVAALSGLAERLPRSQPVYGLQSRGMDQIAAPLRDIASIAAHNISEIQVVQPHGPYLLGGTCDVGGAVAFEMARKLEEQGECVSLLALLDARMSWSPAQRARTELMASFLYRQVHRVEYHLGRLLRLPRKERWAAATEILRRKLPGLRSKTVGARVNDRANGTKASSLSGAANAPGGEMPRYLHEVREANFEALANWLPQSYVGRVTLLWCRQYFEERELDRGALEWLNFATGGVEMQFIEGAHHELFCEPVVQEVACKLNSCIERALERRDCTPYAK